MPQSKLRKPGYDQFITTLESLSASSPKELFREVGKRGYRGQEAPRRSLCLMAYRHLRRIQRIHLEGVPRHELPPKSNCLLVGPTGSGKTFLIETLFRDILKIPTAIVDATVFSETGYVGQDPSAILTHLVQVADYNPYLSAVGVICLDEFDKLASGQNNAVFAGAGTTKDVTGMGVQRELLKMFEASDVSVPLEPGHGGHVEHIKLNTADIPFVAAGAFSGFHELVDRKRDDIGFGRDSQDKGKRPQIAVSFREEEVDAIGNFQSYGFLPELIARFSRTIPFEALSRDTLKEIVQDSVIKKMSAEFDAEGLSLQVEEEVYEHLIDEAVRKETGARGLSSSLLSHLEDAAFEAFGQKSGGVVKVGMIDGKLCVAPIS